MPFSYAQGKNSEELNGLKMRKIKNMELQKSLDVIKVRFVAF